MSKTMWDMIPETTELLKQLITAGQSAGAVSVELSRVFANRCGEISRNMVIGKAHRLGLKLNPENRKNPNQFKASKPASPPARILASISGPPLSPIPKVEAPPIAPVDNGQIGVLLLDLDSGRCKWPIATSDDGFVFCGRRAPKDKTGREVYRSYCNAHCRMAYQPLRGRAA